MLPAIYPVTLLTASILGILIIAVSYKCAMKRMNSKIEIGTGDDQSLQRLMRAQANLTEYAPISIILIGLLEVNNIDIRLLYGLAATLIIARLMHVYGFITKPGKNPGRFYGTLLTWLTILVASGIGLRTVFGI
jgi:hypothetical protein